MTRQSFLGTLAVLISVALGGGCGTPETVSHRPAPSPPFPQPPGVTIPAEVPAEDTLHCDPSQSLRPDGPLPPPGEMRAGTRMAEIKNRGRLIVGIGSNAYLLTFRDPYTGEVRGFEVDIAREIAYAIFGERAPELIQFKTFDLQDRFKVVKDETVDLVIAATTMTCRRWLDVAFSVDYHPGGQRLLVYKNSPFYRIEDLVDKKVCATTGGVNIQTIATAKSIPVGAANTADCMLLLQQGQVDAVSSGGNLLAGLAAQDPATHILDQQLTTTSTGILMSHKHHDLVRFVNGVLEKLISDGTWLNFYHTWLEGQLGSAKLPTPQYQPE